jgi:hypothetical protein
MRGKKRTMREKKRDKTKVNPLSGAEDKEPAAPLKTLRKGQKASASTVIIPGTGEVIKDVTGKEARRLVST